MPREPIKTNDVRIIPFREWCELLGVSRQTGHAMIKRHGLKTVKMSRRKIGIRSDHHAEFVESLTRKT